MSSLYIFTRDLRLEDNPLLARAASTHECVYPVFIFNDLQTDPARNRFYSPRSFQFLCESVEDLASHSPLLVTRGEPADAVRRVVRAIGNVKTVFITRDYTDFSELRLEAINAAAKECGAAVISDYDVLVPVPKSYLVFGAYYRVASAQRIPDALPAPANLRKIPAGILISVDPREMYQPANQMIRGGRTEALRLIAALDPAKLTDYETKRDQPSAQCTTRLSAYIKYGCVSGREVCRAIRIPALVREIIYREFFYQLYLHYHDRFEREWKSVDGWSTNRLDPRFIAWCEGKTGVPAVDAGMRELNATGYMHNRFRMITASYLIHDLHIHWSLGEQYFASRLRDYDPTINKTNWGWVAGLDIFNRRPNTLRFNPELQLARHDKNAVYTKLWIPELRDVPSADILKWSSRRGEYNAVRYP